jgi:hypothetical protein
MTKLVSYSQPNTILKSKKNPQKQKNKKMIGDQVHVAQRDGGKEGRDIGHPPYCGHHLELPVLVYAPRQEVAARQAREHEASHAEQFVGPTRVAQYGRYAVEGGVQARLEHDLSVAAPRTHFIRRL